MNSECETDCKDCGSKCAYKIAVLGAFLIVAGLVWVMHHYTQSTALGEDRAATRRKALMELRAANEAVLNNPNYVWTNQAKGLVLIPITNSMELALKLWQNPAAGRSNLIERMEKATAVPAYE